MCPAGAGLREPWSAETPRRERQELGLEPRTELQVRGRPSPAEGVRGPGSRFAALGRGSGGGLPAWGDGAPAKSLSAALGSARGGGELPRGQTATDRDPQPPLHSLPAPRGHLVARSPERSPLPRGGEPRGPGDWPSPGPGPAAPRLPRPGAGGGVQVKRRPLPSPRLELNSEPRPVPALRPPRARRRHRGRRLPAE